MLSLTLFFACVSPQTTVEDTTPTAEDSGPECKVEDGLPPQPAEDYLAEFRPVVVRTVPQAGDQAVAPGLTELRVTFSKDMEDGNWSWVQVNERQYPESEEAYYADARTNVLMVTLEPEHTYVLWLNYDPDFMSFADTYGNSAIPYQLSFRTAASE